MASVLARRTPSYPPGGTISRRDELARRFAARFCARCTRSLSPYQLQMLTLCLYAFSARRTGKRIRVILMAHGQVAPAMAEVVNHILQDDNAIGFSMDLQESSEQVLERAIRLGAAGGRGIRLPAAGGYGVSGLLCAGNLPAYRGACALRGPGGHLDGAMPSTAPVSGSGARWMNWPIPCRSAACMRASRPGTAYRQTFGHPDGLYHRRRLCPPH